MDNLILESLLLAYAKYLTSFWDVCLTVYVVNSAQRSFDSGLMSLMSSVV